MPMASISGVVSGMDTATIINQLMQIEALPQNRLASRISSEERQVNALQTLNAKLASIAGKAAKIADLSAWSPVTATSTSEHVTVTAADGALPATLSLEVESVATAARNVYATKASADEPVFTTATRTFEVDYKDDRASESFTVDGDSLSDIAEAINTQSEGLRATLVKTGTTTDADGAEVPVYQLHVVSSETGATSGFDIVDPAVAADLTAFLGGDTDPTTGVGTDARVTVNGQTLTSASNRLTGLMPGVDVTISATAQATPTEPISADIRVSRDAKSLADSVQAMVDAVNAALKDIDSLTDYDAATKTGGLLSGDSTLRSVRNDLLASVTTGIDGMSLASVGIEVSREGEVTFDAAAFTQAYEDDPLATTRKFTGRLAVDLDPGSTGTVELYEAGWRTSPGTYRIDADAATGGTIDGSSGKLIGNLLVAADGTAADGLTVEITGQVSGTLTYTQGFAARLEALAQRASDSTIGTVTAAIKGRNNSIERLESDVAGWDVRLELRRQALQRQFTAMEVALGQLQNQGSWLAGQIAGLPSYSSGS